ncbi:MAG: tetratricopeptide repeat protein, partial [Bacteroidota bacterium]
MKQQIVGLMLLLCAPFFGVSQDEVTWQVERLLRESAFSEAEELLTKQMEKDSTQAQWYYYQGVVCAKQYKYLQAKSYFQKAALLDTPTLLYWHQLAAMEVKTGKPEEAIGIYQEYLLREPLKVIYAGELAGLYLKQRSYPQALELYDTLLTIEPGNYYFHKQAAFCHERLQHPKPAQRHYKKAIALYPDDLQLYIRLANNYIRERGFEQAQFVARKGLEQDPQNVALQKILAYSLYLNRQFNASITQFGRVLSLGDTSQFTRKYFGLTLYQAQRYDTAAHWLNEAALWKGDDFEAVFFAGSALVRSGQTGSGIMWLWQALQMITPPNKEVAEIYSEIAEGYIHSENYQQAAHYYKQAYGKNSKAIYSFKLAVLYDKHLENPKLARSYYDGYLGLLRDDVPMQDTLSADAERSLP